MKILHIFSKPVMALTLALAVAGTGFAQLTDVTSSYLSNAHFNTNANFKFDAAAENLGSANGGANIKEVDSWTRGQMGDNSAAGTYEYGNPGTLNAYNTYGTIPTAGPDAATGTGQAALGISTAWTGTVTYTQSVTLPAGKYSIIYEAYNSGPAVTNTSKVGFAPNEGTAFVDNRTSFPMGEWVKDTVSFTLQAETAGVIQVGIAAPNSGSSSVGRIFFDYVKVMVDNSVDKTNLQALITTATEMKNNPQPVGTSTAYADLDVALTNAQAVNANASATAGEVLAQEGLLAAAIEKVNGAITIYAYTTAWTDLPVDITSLIVNPSFEESPATNGWVNVGGFVGQTNTSFSLKESNTYVERWKSTGNWTGLKLSQTINYIPNGIYRLTASALNNPNTVGGAFLFANDERAEVFGVEEKTILVTVTDNKLTIGYEVVNGGNYVATDNFRLSYISDGSPFLVTAPENLFFDANNLTRTFTVSGGNLSADAVITAPAGISLDKSSLTPAEIAAGATVTATYDNATPIADGFITVTSGSETGAIGVIGSADAACFTPLFATGNLIPNPFLNDISAFAGWGHRAVVFGAEAYCGAGAVKFSATTNGWPDGAALDVNGIAWEPNTWYRVRAMLKTVDGTLAFFAKGTDPDVTITIPQSGNDWIEVDELFLTGAAPTTNFFSLNNVDGGSTALTAYIDNWELYKVDLGTGVDNSNVSDRPLAYISNDQIAVRFELDHSADVTLSVFNLQGMTIASKVGQFDAGTNQTSISAGLASGVYIVKMSYEGKEFTTKVVK